MDSVKYIVNSQCKGIHMYNITRQLLDDFYSHYNKELATLLDDDGYNWKI